MFLALSAGEIYPRDASAGGGTRSLWWEWAAMRPFPVVPVRPLLTGSGRIAGQGPRRIRP
jgi:hypothetical protein